MKREILFRGKRISRDEWVYGLPVYAINRDAINAIATKGKTILVEPDTIGQFTGITDSSKDKIFEGDTVTDGKMLFKVESNQQNGKWWLDPQQSTDDEEFSFLDMFAGGQLGNGYYSRKDLTIVK